MNELQTEINELKEFIVDLKADRAATKAKEKREAWTKYVSLTIVIIAVISAIAAQWSGKYSSRVLTQLNNATYFQTQASDQWAYYEAKSIKEKTYQIARDGLLNQPNPDAKTLNLIQLYQKQIAKEQADQETVKQAATDFESQRNHARDIADAASAKGSKMGLAISLFSVGVAVASICLVTKRKPLWFVSMALTAGGLYEMIHAFLA